MSFISNAWQSIIKQVTGVELSVWAICGIIMSILIPIAWVREISKFSFTFLLGNVLILTTVIVVSAVLTARFFSNDMEWGSNLQAVNAEEYWSFVGFSVYAYEGIGVVMPIMEKCACPEKFDKILMAGIGTLTVVYCSFAELCYLILGDEIDENFIT